MSLGLCRLRLASGFTRLYPGRYGEGWVGNVMFRHEHMVTLKGQRGDGVEEHDHRP